MTPVIKTENLTHVYSVDTPFELTAIKDINFEAYQGEFLSIIGHTGSGKSTFIQHLNGLIRPTSGKVYLNGEDIYSSKEKTHSVRFRVGLVFQYPEYQLFEETVYRDIAFGPKNMKLSEEEIDERVREAARFVNLPDDVLEKSPFDLSGGQKRRVAIAGVIAMRPEVLILDEPTAGLDPEGRADIMENIKNYHRARNATIIMVSHSMEEVASVSDRMVVMSRGGIAMDGTPHEVFSRSEELEAMGLSVPGVTKIILRLKSLGVPLDSSVYTTEQAVRAICALKRGRDNA